jgi:hypothetical protein
MNAPAKQVIEPVGFRNERLLKRLREDKVTYAAIRHMFVERREQRRAQTETMTVGNVDVMRGRCQELTSILIELFPEE